MNIKSLKKLYKKRKKDNSDKRTSFAYAKLEASEHNAFGIRLYFYRRHYSVGLFLKDLLSKIACPSPISCSIKARAFNGRPNNVINPSASL